MRLLRRLRDEVQGALPVAAPCSRRVLVEEDVANRRVSRRRAGERRAGFFFWEVGGVGGAFGVVDGNSPLCANLCEESYFVLSTVMVARLEAALVVRLSKTQAPNTGKSFNFPLE